MTGNQLVDEPRFGIGGNFPPLDEYLPELLAPLAKRQAQIIEVAKSARIVDRESAEKVVDLDKFIKALADELEAQREQIKRPYLDACKLIDSSFGALTQPLTVARTDTRAMLTSWQRAQEERAEEVRQRFEAERRLAEAQAEAARRAAEEKRAKGSAAVADELEAMQAEEQARRLERQAAAVAPEPLRSHLGAVGTRREINFEITDEKKTLAWLYKQRRAEIMQASRTIVGAVLRSMGVAAAESAQIPGVAVKIERRVQVR